jgi:hypothetical protein
LARSDRPHAASGPSARRSGINRKRDRSRRETRPPSTLLVDDRRSTMRRFGDLSLPQASGVDARLLESRMTPLPAFPSGGITGAGARRQGSAITTYENDRATSRYIPSIDLTSQRGVSSGTCAFVGVWREYPSAATPTRGGEKTLFRILTIVTETAKGFESSVAQPHSVGNADSAARRDRHPFGNGAAWW